jgi:hypothetical protein
LQNASNFSQIKKNNLPPGCNSFSKAAFGRGFWALAQWSKAWDYDLTLLRQKPAMTRQLY